MPHIHLMPWPTSKPYSLLFFLRRPEPKPLREPVAVEAPAVICMLYNVPQGTWHPAWFTPSSVAIGGAEGYTLYDMAGHLPRGFPSRDAAAAAVQALTGTGQVVSAASTIFAWDGMSDPGRSILVWLSGASAEDPWIINPPRPQH
ncbi:hypothetical protein [Microvirga massiliensis]|uniref:hypothetical protein n=1 Tax=Microvirga massiliensis TaxID=1033741 RepID=UPI00062B863F|nr:hypothetical protein [Microvirga massiliensis]